MTFRSTYATEQATRQLGFSAWLQDGVKPINPSCRGRLSDGMHPATRL